MNWLRGTVLLVTSAFFTTSSLGLGFPELMPGYADASVLRSDATLRAVAFDGINTATATGIACGDRGALWRSDDGGDHWHLLDSGVDCLLSDVVWVDSRRVVVVGGGYDRITQLSRGVVLFSKDAGRTWQRSPDRELPRLRQARRREDGSVAVSGDWSHSVLTRELESRDGGRSWVASGPLDKNMSVPRPPSSRDFLPWVEATGLPVAIRDACRIGKDAICAVGEHGVILKSTNRGTSWQTVRGDRRQTSIVVLASDAAAVPWSLVGSEALEHRHRVAILVMQDEGSTPVPTVSSSVGHPNVSPPDMIQQERIQRDIANQVAVMLGASGVDFIGSAGGDPNDSVIRQLAVDWIAIHRPSVLVLGQQLPVAISDAFMHAAAAGGVRRVVVHSREGKGQTTVHRQALLRKSGVLASDLTADALQFIAPNHLPDPTVCLEYIYDATPSTQRGVSVMAGAATHVGRKLSVSTRTGSLRKLQIAQARLRQTDRMQELFRSSRSVLRFEEAFTSLLDQTAKEDQFRLIWSTLVNALHESSGDSSILGARPVQPQQWQQVAMKQMMVRFPETSAAKWAQIRLDAMNSSAEWRRLAPSLSRSAGDAHVVQALPSVPVSPFQSIGRIGVRQVSAVSPVVVPKVESQQVARQTVKPAEEVDLTWEFHPLQLLASDAARRRGSDGELQVTVDTSADLERLVDGSSSEWAHLASAMGGNAVVARRAGARPRLDGVIQEDCWQQHPEHVAVASRLRVAYDDDYIYFATRTPTQIWGPSKQQSVPPASSRDQNLSDVHRMKLRIDIDRDLLSSMELEFSEDGRTRDTIDGVDQWQPTWYVDTRRDDDFVVCEVAVLRRDLVELPITIGSSWLLSAQLLRPGDSDIAPIMPNPSSWVRVTFEP